MAKPRNREPEYVTSLIRNKPIEMIVPRKIACLILLERGWIGRCEVLTVPERFTTYRVARRRNRPEWMQHRMYLRVPSFSQIMADWRAIGIVWVGVGIECDIRSRCAITPKGKALLKKIPPEMLAAARAVVRASIWQVVLNRRAEVRLDKELAQDAEDRCSNLKTETAAAKPRTRKMQNEKRRAA